MTRETQVRSLDGEDPLEEGMATHSSVLAWETPWTEEPGKTTVHGVAESDTTEATEHTPAMPLATAQCSAPSPGLNPSLWNLDAGLLTGRVQWLPTAPRVRPPSHPAPCTPHTLCIAEGTPRTSASDQRRQGHTGEREERCAEGLSVSARGLHSVRPGSSGRLLASWCPPRGRGWAVR